MNIFILDLNPKIAAENQIDKHIVKMPLETAQILCTAFKEAPYKKSHYNHPSCIWARKSRGNFLWLVEHGLALGEEYTKRYGKIHKSISVIEWCRDNISLIDFEEDGITPFALAMPDEYKCSDPVESYRKYYLNDKRNIATWKTSPPSWWN